MPDYDYRNEITLKITVHYGSKDVVDVDDIVQSVWDHLEIDNGGDWLRAEDGDKIEVLDAVAIQLNPSDTKLDYKKVYP